MNDKAYIAKENKELIKYFKDVVKMVGHNETTDNFELNRAGTHFLGNNFKGVYASDRVPDLANGTCCILNIDKHNQKGSHWVALYFHNSTYLFFDSYGFSWRDNIPKLKKYLANITKQNIEKIDIISCETIRQWTEYQTYCGQISLAWLIYIYKQPNPLMSIVI